MTNHTPENRDWLIPAESHDHLRDLLTKADAPVHVDYYTGRHGFADHDAYTRRFIEDLILLCGDDPFVSAEEKPISGDEATELGLPEQGGPVVVIDPDGVHLRFFGAPTGGESKSFIEALLLVSLSRSGLSAEITDALDTITRPREVLVFVSPTCPYCPAMALLAIRFAIHLGPTMRLTIVEISQNPDLALAHNAASVPATVITRDAGEGSDPGESDPGEPDPGESDGPLHLLGLRPEALFAHELVHMHTHQDEDGHGQHGGHDHGHDHGHNHDIDILHTDLVIIGGGPAGLTAAIYGRRAGLQTTVVEKKNIGGQLAVTPFVENWPGLSNVGGAQLTQSLADHAREYATIREYETVTELKIGKHVEVYTDKAVHLARAAIIATGATWRTLGIPGEDRFHGRGVSFCASCDGYYYQNKKVLIVGGGNTALTDALHLHGLGVDVTLVHRRDAFSAQQHLIDTVTEKHIPVFWNTVCVEVLGEENVTGARLQNTLDNTEYTEPCDGLFIAIGVSSNNQLAADIGITLNPDGSIHTDTHRRTSMPHIYAAGDVTGDIRQIVTATAEGATAAMTAFEDLNKSK